MRIDGRIKKLEVSLKIDNKIIDENEQLDLSSLTVEELEELESLCKKSNEWKELSFLSTEEIKRALAIIKKVDKDESET